MIKSWNFYNIAPRFDQIYECCATTKTLSISVESQHNPMLSAKRHKCKIAKGHGKSRNGHRKVMENYFVKSVGTLCRVEWLVTSLPPCTLSIMAPFRSADLAPLPPQSPSSQSYFRQLLSIFVVRMTHCHTTPLVGAPNPLPPLGVMVAMVT